MSRRSGTYNMRNFKSPLSSNIVFQIFNSVSKVKKKTALTEATITLLLCSLFVKTNVKAVQHHDNCILESAPFTSECQCKILNKDCKPLQLE